MVGYILIHASFCEEVFLFCPSQRNGLHITLDPSLEMKSPSPPPRMKEIGWNGIRGPEGPLLHFPLFFSDYLIFFSLRGHAECRYGYWHDDAKTEGSFKALTQKSQSTRTSHSFFRCMPIGPCPQLHSKTGKQEKQRRAQKNSAANKMKNEESEFSTHKSCKSFPERGRPSYRSSFLKAPWRLISGPEFLIAICSLANKRCSSWESKCQEQGLPENLSISKSSTQRKRRAQNSRKWKFLYRMQNLRLPAEFPNKRRN